MALRHLFFESGSHVFESFLSERLTQLGNVLQFMRLEEDILPKNLGWTIAIRCLVQTISRDEEIYNTFIAALYFTGQDDLADELRVSMYINSICLN